MKHLEEKTSSILFFLPEVKPLYSSFDTGSTILLFQIMSISLLPSFKLRHRHSIIQKHANRQYHKAETVIAITHKDQPQELTRALKSAIAQDLLQKGEAQIYLLDDGSKKGWFQEVEALLSHPAITFITAKCGSPARARNLLLDLADQNPHVKWVARLDADDELATPQSLSALKNAAEEKDALAVIGSHAQRHGNDIMPELNLADKEALTTPEKLQETIYKIRTGQQEKDLPSYNLLLQTRTGCRYPNIRSAEDHWLVIGLCLLKPTKVTCVTDPLYGIYSVTGTDTAQNKKSQKWFQQRERLEHVIQRFHQLQKAKKHPRNFDQHGFHWEEKQTHETEFYPWSLDPERALYIKQQSEASLLPFVTGLWHIAPDKISVTRNLSLLTPLKALATEKQIQHYLKACLTNGIANLNCTINDFHQTTSGDLINITLNQNITHMTPENFLEMSIKLYSACILGQSPDEWFISDREQHSASSLSDLSGFDAFYKNLLTSLPDSQKMLYALL